MIYYQSFIFYRFALSKAPIYKHTIFFDNSANRFILAQTLNGSSVDLSVLEVKKNCPILFSWFEKVIDTNSSHLSKRTNQSYLLILK